MEQNHISARYGVGAQETQDTGGNTGWGRYPSFSVAGTRAGSGGAASPPCSHPQAAAGSSARGKGSIDPPSSASWRGAAGSGYSSAPRPGAPAELLLALLHKYTGSNSQWCPYFSLWQDFRSLDHPMFWPEEEQRWLLQGTGIPEAVEKDLASIHLEYSSMILPFIESYPNIFDPKLHTLELYKQLVAFIMAYR